MENDESINTEAPQARLKKRAEALMQSNDLPSIALMMADLENDFEYVKELNSVIADKYEFVTKHLPTPAEIDVLLERVDAADARDRLKSLKKICVALKTDKPFVSITQQTLKDGEVPHATE